MFSPLLELGRGGVVTGGEGREEREGCFLCPASSRDVSREVGKMAVPADCKARGLGAAAPFLLAGGAWAVPHSLSVAGADLEASLLSFEKLDRASPDLWPEQRKSGEPTAVCEPRAGGACSWAAARAGPGRVQKWSGRGRGRVGFGLPLLKALTPPLPFVFSS